jgi:hypothetical protein
MTNTSRSLALIALHVFTFMSGYMFYFFVEVQEVSLPYIPIALVAMVVLNVWAMFTFIGAERDEVIKTQVRVRR